MTRRSSEVPQSTRRELWRLSMGQCTLCEEELGSGVDGTLPTATVAHIVALEDGGPRADPTLSIERRNALENLLLLCPRCHDLIDKDAATHPAEVLRERKREHEARIAAARAASRGWNMRFMSIDYVNLPRVAMMPGGEQVQRIAAEAGLDDRRPFTGQGLAPGAFLQRLRPILETWNARAVPLDASTVQHLSQGALVSFELGMKARIPASPPGPGNFPALTATLAGRSVEVRFDPQWLTTSTAGDNVDTAQKHTTIFAGLGVVVRSSGADLRVSALLFGQPQPAQGAMAEFLTGTVDAPRHVSVELFEVPSAPVAAGRSLLPMTVALHFDEDALVSGQLAHASVRHVHRVVPE
jgi:5-methylcytosine-specific restriction endonuclease McrA